MNSKKVVMASMFAALCCVATMIIKIPSPMKGYINIGDCVVLLSGFMLSPLYGFLAAGVGSALADIFLGYVIYAPVTFVIKGTMALVAYYGYMLIRKRLGNTLSRVMSGALAEFVMVSGYFIAESFMYGVIPAMSSIPGSIFQGTVGLILGVILVKIFEKNKISF